MFNIQPSPMKINAFFIFAFIITNGWAQKNLDTLLVNNTMFITIQQTARNEYYPKNPDTLIYFYRLENEQKTYLLKHYTYHLSGDCNNEFTDIGYYQVKGDSIIFITEYDQKLSDPIPLSRRQVYMVKPTGKLLLISDRTEDYDGKWANTNQ
jgi:hypothetical protein